MGSPNAFFPGFQRIVLQIRDLQRAYRPHPGENPRRRACTTSGSHRTSRPSQPDFASSDLAARHKNNGNNTDSSWDRISTPEPPKVEVQLFGGCPGPFPSRQIYQSRCSEVRDDFESRNHLCWSEVWFTTKSRMMRMPCFLASLASMSKSASVPYMGSIFS